MPRDVKSLAMGQESKRQIMPVYGIIRTLLHSFLMTS